MKQKCIFVVIICCFMSQIASSKSESPDLVCSGRMTVKNVTLTAYYPSDDQDNSIEYLDRKGHTLATLQDFLDGKVDYVTVSMDEDLKIPYGTRVCIPELNGHYRRPINFEIRDSASNVKRQGVRRVDICVRSEADSYDISVNLKHATVVF